MEERHRKLRFKLIENPWCKYHTPQTCIIATFDQEKLNGVVETVYLINIDTHDIVGKINVDSDETIDDAIDNLIQSLTNIGLVIEKETKHA